MGKFNKVEHPSTVELSVSGHRVYVLATSYSMFGGMNVRDLTEPEAIELLHGLMELFPQEVKLHVLQLMYNEKYDESWRKAINDHQ